MREIKILAVIILFAGVTYWGVEPLAHSIFHPHVKPADYSFSDLEKVGEGLTPNLENGQMQVTSNCVACHSINALGMPAPMGQTDASASYGVNPPDLSNVATLYESNYLASFIKNPVVASKLAHKFDDGTGSKSAAHPMPSYNWMSDQDIVDMVAYLKSIAKTELTNKEVFVEACARCHSLKYGKVAVGSDLEPLTKYMGTTPPDLSQMIRSRSKDYLHTFVNDPQKKLKGTSMPRVGLTQEAEAQVVAYMEEIGDSSKPKREALGPKVLIYLAIFTIFAFLFKRSVWKDLK